MCVCACVHVCHKNRAKERCMFKPYGMYYVTFC